MQRRVPAGRRVSSCGGAIVVLVVVMGLTALAQAQSADRKKSEKAPPQGVTDLISVAGGGEIRGAVVKRLPDGSLDVAVQRDWLETSAPEAAEVLGAQERRQTKAVMEALAKRLAAAIAPLPESRTRTLGLLRREADRVDDWLAAAEQADDRDAPQQRGEWIDRSDHGRQGGATRNSPSCGSHRSGCRRCSRAGRMRSASPVGLGASGWRMSRGDRLPI